MRRRLALFLLLPCLAAACTAPVESTSTPYIPPMCRGARSFVASGAGAEWTAETSWAFEEWKRAVPSLGTASFREGEVDASECLTPIRAVHYDDATLGETAGGELHFSDNAGLTEEGRRWLALHELGHLLFGLGHSTDPASTMYPIAHVPAVISDDSRELARKALP